MDEKLNWNPGNFRTFYCSIGQKCYKQTTNCNFIDIDILEKDGGVIG